MYVCPMLCYSNVTDNNYCILACYDKPCHKGRTAACRDVKDGDRNYKCECKPGFVGVHCDTRE